MNVSAFQKYTNAASRFIFIDDALIHYRDEGQGEAILLLHGTFSSLHTFDAWAERLKAKYRVLRFDLPGFGLSECSDNHANSIQGYVHYVRRFINLMGIEKCHLAGNSLGGWIAWEFAWQDSRRLHSLTLLDAAGYLSLDNIPLPFKMARAPFVSQSVVRMSVQRALVVQMVSQVYADSRKITEPLIDRYYDLFVRNGNPQAFHTFANSRFKDNTLHLPAIHVRTLIMWGEEDRWLPISNAHRFHSDIPDSELIIYRQVGHVPMEEVPETTVGDFMAFIGE